MSLADYLPNLYAGANVRAEEVAKARLEVALLKQAREDSLLAAEADGVATPLMDGAL